MRSKKSESKGYILKELLYNHKERLNGALVRLEFALDLKSGIEFTTLAGYDRKKGQYYKEKGVVYHVALAPSCWERPKGSIV